MASRLEEPDTGYAWVIAFAACFINMLLSGMGRMIGILYVAVIEAYGVTRKEASLPFTVRNAFRYLTGPLVGVLGQRFGIRSVTFFGGIVAALGSILCCFAPSVTWISFFWGGIHGFGFAMANTLFVVVVNQYFERNRATASGIVLSGACLGSFALPGLLEWMLASYGVFGLFLLSGATFLHVLPPSLLLKSPPWVEDPEGYARQRALVYGLKPQEPEPRSQDLQVIPRGKSQRSLSNCSVTEFDVFNVASGTQRSFLKEFRLSNTKNRKFKPSAILEEASTVVCTSYQTANDLYLHQENVKSKNDEVSKKPSVYLIPTDNETHNKQPKGKTTSRQQESMQDIARSIALLYINPHYLLISFSLASYFWLFIPILTVVLDYSRDKSVLESDRKYLIHALTVGDLIGRVGFGWVTDKHFLSFPVFMALSFAFQGVFIALLPLATSLWLFMTAMALYGVMAGIIFVYFPVLVHQYVDNDHQPVGIGCMGLVSGVLTLGIPRVIGHYRDNVGSYDGLFYILGLISIGTGILWLFEPIYLIVRRRKGDQENS